MILTNENYFSPEAMQKFFSNSQVKGFMRCEAQALSELNGDYEREVTTSLLVGSYVDAHFEGTLDLFKAQHPEIVSTKGKTAGQLKSEYRQAEDIISKLENDVLFSMLMSGEKQVIMTGDVAGYDFKIKIDSLLSPAQVRAIVETFPDTKSVFGQTGIEYGAIVDMKTTKDFEDIWNPINREKQNFVEFWGYDIQGAIYQSVVSSNNGGNKLPFIIAAVTKEKSGADMAALHIPDDVLAEKLAEIVEAMPRIAMVKDGLFLPHRCGKCAYCKQTKILKNIIDYREVNL